MLAVHRPMASHPHGLLRQPSADDLDAAHQLIQSSRGERTFANQNIAQQHTPIQPRSPLTNVAAGHAAEPAPPLEADEQQQQLGQVCR